MRLLKLALPALAWLPLTLHAQMPDQAPAGNAHPEAEMIAEVHATNPFGQPRPTQFDKAEKAAFAEQVDLSPLRDLAVFHNGRVKILDTLARESIGAMMGRRNYVDFIESEVEGKTAKGDKVVEVDKVGYDPLFTYIDMIIDPGYYADKPLIHIEYLPLRELFLDRAFEDPQEHERWKRLGRLTPRIVSDFGNDIATTMPVEAEYQRGMDRIVTAMGLYNNNWRNLLMIAPESADRSWHHLSELSSGSPTRAALQNLGTGWREGDAARVNAAAQTLAQTLPQINGDMYPTTKRRLEAMYNASSPFSWGYWIYGLSFVLLLLAFGTRWKVLVWAGIATLVVAIGLHAFGFSARSYIAERYAIQNQFESMTGVSLGAALIGCIIMLIRRQWLFGAAAAGVGFLMLVTASTTGIPGQTIEREAAILNTSVLLKYHVTTVLMSYGMIALAFIISLFYLGTYYAAKARGTQASVALPTGGGAVEVSAGALGLDDDAPVGPQRVLNDLDKAQMIIIQLAFWGLGVGILLGAWWADHSWGRWWAFDPKELSALITWIVYLIIIHVRFTTGRSRGLVTAWLSIIGFGVMIFTYFGVNLLLPGLHAYA